MKIRVFDRIATAIIALVLIAVTLFLIGVAWNIIKQPIVEQYVDAFYNVNINSWILTGIACVVLIMALALFFIAFGRDKKGNRYLELENAEFGSIRVADSTFKDMINKNTRDVVGVLNSKSSIKNVDKNIIVFIKAELMEDVVMQDICTQIQNQVKTNVEAMCGIQIDKVNVMIENKPKD